SYKYEVKAPSFLHNHKRLIFIFPHIAVPLSVIILNKIWDRRIKILFNIFVNEFNY
ncbi:hypothetical protein L9F63_026406, partial [Diploptera punctata]